MGEKLTRECYTSSVVRWSGKALDGLGAECWSGLHVVGRVCTGRGWRQTPKSQREEVLAI